MARILFVPSALNEVATIAMVRPELTGDLSEGMLAVALDERLEVLLKEGGFPYRHFSDYQARNALEIIKQEDPDLVLTNDFSDLTRALIFAANHLSIPSLQVDDGVTYSPPIKYGTRWYSPQRIAPRRVLRWLKSDRRLHWCHNLIFTLRTLKAISNLPQALMKLRGELDYRYPRPHIRGLRFAVVGQYAKEAYIDMGVEPGRVFITGQPRFDMIFKREFNRDTIMSQLGILRDKGMIVLATQPLALSLWTETEQQEFAEVVVEAMAELPDQQLVIKLHPAEYKKYYQGILTKMGQEKPIICQQVDLYQLLHACDLLITAQSTVALEAMLFDKPVLTINLSGKPDFMPYAESGAAIGVYRKEDLIPAMKDALYNPRVREDLAKNREAFVLAQSYKTDGQASKRVAELIARLIREYRR